MLLNADSKITSRLRAIEFFFCTPTAARMSLDETLQAIDPAIRPDVFRLRLMFEFWNRWTVFGRALPDDALPPPDRINTLASFYGAGAQVMVSEVWYRPGITSGELMEACDAYRDDLSRREREDLPRILNELKANYVVSERNDSLYITGKNPVLEVQDTMRRSGRVAGARNANISWARLF